jgi:uncharacterized repeat protein (TIGR01451 family)
MHSWFARSTQICVETHSERPTAHAWRLSGLFLILGLLGLAQPASAAYVQRYVTTTRGGVTFTGNTLGLSRATGGGGANAPGTNDSIGAFSTTNTGLTVGTYPAGTTADWHLNSAAATLTLPAGSSVLHAELIWGSTIASGTQDITASITTPVSFTAPGHAAVTIAPDPTAAQQGGGRYVNASDVTAQVQAAGAGTYIIGGVPGTLGNDDTGNATGWTLAVAYSDSTAAVRNLSVFVGAEIGGAAAAQVSGFCTPSTGVVNSRVLVTALEGDANRTGDTFLFGPTATLTNANRLSGTNNPITNFFASQLNQDSGALDTSGTFGARNQDATAGTNIVGGRQGWDVTNVSGSGQLGNNQTSAFAQGTTTGDQYTVAGLGLQIDVFAPSFPVTVKQVDHASTFVGDVLTYTVTLNNNGQSTANSVVFNDPVPANTSFVAGSFKIDGVAQPGVLTPVGVAIGSIANGTQKVITFQVHVDSIPADLLIHNTAHWTYNFTACASAIPGSVDTNEITTPLTVVNLGITKTDGSATYTPGSPITYTLVASNTGPSAATGATVTDTLPAAITGATWTALYAGGASGPASGSGNISATVNVPVGGTATFTLSGTVGSATTGVLSNTATIAAPANATDSAPGNNSATDADAISALANLGITKTDSSATAIPGSAVTYTIVASNAGPSDAVGATVADTLPAALSGATWTAVYAGGASGPASGSGNINATVTLPSGGTATFTVTGTISASATGTLANTATVTAPAGVTDPTPGNNSATDTDTLTAQANLGITKTDGSASAVPGSAISYTIVATNAGPSIATGAVVADTIPAAITGATWTAVYASGATGPVSGSGNINATVNIPVGGTATFTVTGTVSSTATGTLSNTATVTPPAGTTDPTPGDNSSTDTDTLNPQANLGITKTDGSASAVPGSAISYTIVATNAGPSIATGAVVADTIPATITGAAWTAVYAGGASGPASGSGNISATINIPVGGTATFTVTGTVSASATGTLSNTATVTPPAGTTDPTPGNNSATDTDTLNPQANLGISKTDGSASAVPGSAISYTIVATNAGPSIATGAVVADTIPATITGAAWTAVYAGGATGPASGAGNINATVNIPVGGTVTFTVTGTVSSTATGTLANTATITPPTGTTDPTPGDNSATDTDTLNPQANLAITKTDGSASATPGSAISYTIVATNAGPSIATGAVVADTIPATIIGATWTAVYASGATGPASGSGNINATVNIPVGGTATFTVTGTVSSTATGTLANTATITPPAGTTDPTPGDNSSTDTDTLTPSANLGITKTDGSTSATPGSAISYTIVATNAGPSIATGAVVADTIPAAITGATWTAVYAGGATGPASGSGNVNATVNIPVGGTATFTVSGTVSASATGTLSNTATITPPAGTTDPTPANNSATDTDTLTASADIEAVKTGTASIGFGGALSYTVVVTNHGPSDANATTFSDAVPAGITGVTANCGTPTGGAACGTVNVAGNNVTSTITTLPSGGSVTFTINGNAPTSGASVTNSATANPPTGTTDPTPGNNTGSATTTLLQPQLTVTKTATPNPFTVGQPASYTITVSNTGAGPTAGNITLADTLPVGITLASASGTNWSCAGTTTLSCTFTGTIAAGNSAVLTLNVNVAANAANANNSATASGGGDPTCPATARCTGTTTVPVNPSADIAVIKSVDNATPNVGENVTFTVTVTNNGPNNATGVAITDALPSGLLFVSATPSQGTYVQGTGVWSVGALTNGANATLQITATVLTPGGITNTATKTAGNQFDPNTGNNAGSAMLNAQPSADLQVTKTVSNATPNLGTSVTFTITVHNAGPNNATGVVIDDLLPLGLNYVSSTVSQGSYNNASGVWTVGAITNGADATLTLTATVTLPGDITNTASVAASDQHDPNPANNSSGVTENGQSSDIQVLKGVDNANPVRGDTLTFTITATNNGPSNATGVAITDGLPAGLTFVSATPSQGTYVNGTGVWTVGNLAATGPGATATLTIVADVDTDSGFTNTATLSAVDQTDPNPANNSASVVVTPIASADVSITKTDGATTAVPGSTITYTIVVGNAGPSPAMGATVTDTLPAALTGATWTAVYAGGATGFTSGAGNINTSVDLPVGGTVTFTVTGTLSASATGTLSNTATIAPPAGTTDPTPGNNSATDTDTLAPQANLGISKTDGSASATPGSAISYTIVATNAGPSIATGAVVTDTIPAAISGAAWTAVYASGATGPASGTGNINATVDIPVGGTATFTVTGTISASATGTLTNTATITPPAGTTDPTPGDNSATDTDTLNPQANLAISKTDGATTATPGSPITYTIVATNAGPSIATGAVVADTIPASITGATWTAIYAGGASGPASGSGNINATVNIPVGGTATFTVTGTISANATGTLANTATITPPAGTTDPVPGNNSATDTDTLNAQANLGISKTDSSATYTPGSPISYTIVATNAGPSTATGAMVVDTLPAAITGATWTAVYAGGATGPASGSGNINATVNIPVGGTATFTLTGTVNAGATGTLANTATIAAPPGTTDPVPGNNAATDSDTSAPSSDIVAVKSGPASVGFGGALSYSVVVTNNGPSNANATTFSDAVPAGVSAITANCGAPAGGAVCGTVNVAGNNVTSTITTLPSGGSVTFTINGSAPLSGASLTNTATANPPAGTTDPDPTSNSSSVTTSLLPPQLTVTKSASPTPFVVGQPATYTITVQNTGSGATNAPITLADNLPTGITLASATGTNWSCSGTTNLSCTFSGTLAAGATTTLTLNVNVAASATSANNTATASGGGDPSCPAAAHCTGTVVDGVAASADIAVAKTVDNPTPNVGEAVTFTITATNNGPSNATGVAITDALPSGLAFVSATPSQGSFTPGSGLWTVGALANGASATLQITANVLIPGAMTNTATKTAGDQLDPDTSNNTASASLNAQPSADLQVLKIADNAVPNLGTNVTFTITVTNAGPNDATGVVISDVLPLGLNYVSSTASQGSYNDVTGLWTVGAITHGTAQTLTITATATLPGDVTNTASVSASDQHDPNPANNSSGTTINGQSADVQVVKTVDNANPVRGDTVTFTITATNNGPSNATGIAITDALPAGLVFVSATPSQGSYTSGTGVWAVGNLAATGPAATATLAIVATVNTDGGFTNTASITAANQPDPNPANNTSSVVVTPIASADMSVVKSGPASVVAGQNVSYTLAVTNNGPSPAAAVSLVDPTPAGLTFVSATAPCAGGFPCALGTVNAGATVNVTAVFAVPAGYSSATITNTATVSSSTADPNPANNNGSATTQVTTSADVEVVKTGPASAMAGQNASYTIAVTNHGPSNAQTVSLADPAPAGLSFVSASAPCAGGFPCALGTVNAGQTISVTAVFAVPSGYSGASITNIATATGSTTDPDPSNNSSSVTTPVTTSADIAVVKTGPASVNSGAGISYTVVVSNAGPSDANGASFSDPVPAGITGVTASCGGATVGAVCGTVGVAGNNVTSTITTLPAGSSITLTISGNAPFGAQTLTNTATATPPGGVSDPNPVNNSSSAGTTIGGAADIALTKIVDNTAPNVGNSVTFTITATNHGPNDASGVAVTDSLPAGLGFVSATPSQGSYVSATGQWTIGAIANGASVTLTITATVDQPGGLTNTVAVSASDQPDPDTSNNNAGASINAGATADIAIAKSVDNATPNVGGTVTYTITATNHGPNDATGVEATDHLPAGTTFVSANPSQGSYDNVGGVWTIGALANGATATLTVTVNIAQPGSITNAVTITHEDQFDPVGANNQAGVTINGQQADLAVTKTVDNATPNVGQNVTFTVSVHNNGPSAASNVALGDQLPAGLTFVSATPSQGSYSNATGVWTVGSLSAAGTGSSATLSMVATVTQAGALVNTATVSGSDQPDPNTTNNSDSAALNGNPQADLAVDKSGPATVTPGNNVVYTIVVSNSGPSDATNVLVADVTPAGLTFVGNAGACATAYPCTIATLASGASATITTTYSVPAAYAGANPIINTASATSDTPDPDTTNNQSSVQTGVGPGNADLAIVKTGPATLASGAAIAYTLTITNNGPSPANGAAYSDNVPAGITAISASCGGATGGAACGTPPAVSGNLVSGTVGSLPSGGVVVITINGIVPSGPVALTNTATVNAPVGVNDPAPANNSSTVVTNVAAQSADLGVVKSGPANVAPGTNVTYTLTVTNAGPDIATNAVLNDATPAGLTFVSASLPCQAGFPCALGNLAAGGSTIVTVTFAVPANASGSLINTATVGSDTPDPNSANNSSTVTTPVVPIATSADLALVKTGPASITAGTNATYTLQVTNNGPDAATNVMLADPTPAGLSVVSATAPCAGGFPCALGTLANGATVTVTVTFAVPVNAIGPIINTGSVSSGTSDPNGSNNSSSVTTTVVPFVAASADLTVTKTGPATVVGGGTISYTIVVANQGPDAVPDAMLIDPTPAGLTFVSASAPCASGFPCAVGALANGASVTVTTNYTVTTGFIPSVTNTASANSATVPDPTPINNSSTVATTVTGAPAELQPVPVDARWMLTLMALLLMLIGAPLAMRRR